MKNKDILKSYQKEEIHTLQKNDNRLTGDFSSVTIET